MDVDGSARTRMSCLSFSKWEQSEGSPGMQFALWRRSADGLIWIYSRLVRFECGEGGLFQSFSLALECEINHVPCYKWLLHFLPFVYCEDWFMRQNVQPWHRRCLYVIARLQLFPKCTSVCTCKTDLKLFTVLPNGFMKWVNRAFQGEPCVFLLSLCCDVAAREESTCPALRHSTLISNQTEICFHISFRPSVTLCLSVDVSARWVICTSSALLWRSHIHWLHIKSSPL